MAKKERKAAAEAEEAEVEEQAPKAKKKRKAEEQEEAEVEEPAPKAKKKRKVEEQTEEAEPEENAPNSKKKQKTEQAEEEAADSTPATKTQLRKQKKAEKQAAAAAAAAGDEGEEAQASKAGGKDWAARKAEKKQKKAEARAKAEAEAAAGATPASADELQNRQAKNVALREKGQMTKKEKYKAAKAAKKAAAAAGGGAGSKAGAPPAGDDVAELEAKALAAAGMKTLDPAAVRCFLTGLPYMASAKHVEAHFAKVGACSVELLRDKTTGKATGKAIVTFSKAPEALRACTYSGSKLQNRWINVRLCEIRPGDKLAAGGAAGAGPGTKPAGCLSVVVKCGKSTTEDGLWSFFEDCGATGVSCLTDRETGLFRGLAFVDFDDTAMVDEAVKKSGQILEGQPCLVRYKTEKADEAKGASSTTAPKHSGGDGRIAAHNRAPPVPPPSGKKTKLDTDSEAEDDEDDE